MLLAVVSGPTTVASSQPPKRALGPVALASATTPSTANPDYGWVTTGDGDLVPINALTGAVGTPVNIVPGIETTYSPDALFAPSMSPDGRSVFFDIYAADSCEYCDGQPLFVYQTGPQTVAQVSGLPDDPDGWVYGYPSVLYAPDGSTAYVVVPGTSELYTIDLSNPTEVASSEAIGTNGSSTVALSADGTLLYAIVQPTYEGPFYLDSFDVSDGDEVSSAEINSNDSGTVAYDGLVVDSVAGTAYTTEDIQCVSTCGGGTYVVAYSVNPDGSGDDAYGAEQWSEEIGGNYPIGGLTYSQATGDLGVTDYWDGDAFVVPTSDPSDFLTIANDDTTGMAFTPDGLAAVDAFTGYGDSGTDVQLVSTVPSPAAGADVDLGSVGGPSGVTFLPFASPLGGPLAWQEMLAGNGGEPCGPCFQHALGMKFPGSAPESPTGSLSAAAGDPVDTAWGDLDESFTDATVAGFGPALDFTRSYSSQIAENEVEKPLSPGPLGYGWSESWDASLSFPESGEVLVTEGSGAANLFQAPSGTPLACPVYGQVDPLGLSTSGTYCAPPRVTATLSYSGSQYTYTLGDGTTDTFNSSGQLTAVTDADGAADAIDYDTPTPNGTSTSCNTSFATSCEKIVGPGSSGDRYLVLAFNASGDSGQIVKVSDSQGRHWSYAYDSHDNLTSVTDPRGYATTYGYDTGDSNADLVHDLVTVVNPNNLSAWESEIGAHPSAISTFCGDPSSSTAPGSATVYCYDWDSGTLFGQVVAQADPMGRVTTFSYCGSPATEATGTTTVTQPDGETDVDTYRDSELVAQSENPNSADGTSTWYYGRDDGALLPTTIIDPDGHVTSMTYDTAGNVLTETDALGQTWTYGYAQPQSDQPNFEVQTCATLPEAATPCSGLSPPGVATASNSTVTPPSSAPPAFTTYSEYDTDGNPVWTSVGQWASGASSATNTTTSYWLYDNGSTSQSVTIDSHSASCSAVAPGRELPCATVDPAAIDTESGSNLADAVTQLGYDSDGDLTSSAIPDGNSGGELSKTTWSYNNDGQVLSEVAPLGNVSGGSASAYTTSTTYDSDGLPTEIDVSTGSSERSTEYGYDEDDNETSVENPLTGTTTTTYDADDEPNLVTDPDSHATLTCYDGDGQVSQVVPPTGVAAGSLTGASCPTSSFNVQLETDATTYSYDALGDMATERSPTPNGQSASYETTTDTYDPAGRLVKTVTPSADTTNDPDGVVTLYNYDAAGRLVATSTGTGSTALAVTSYCYDPDGDRTATVPPDGNSSASVETDGLTLTGYTSCSTSSPYQTSSSYQTAYTYDSTGDLLTDTVPATSFASDRVTTDAYDASGELTSSEDPNGVTDTMTYTPLGELASETYSGGSGSTPSVTNTYDADGELKTMVDGTGTSSYSYDAFGDVSSYENGDSETVSYEYNKLGEPTQVTYPLPSGTSWDTHPYATLAYDDAGLLTSVTDLKNTETQFSYTDDELLHVMTFPSTIGTVTTTYDNADNVEEVDSATASTLTYSYDYEPSGAIESETDTGTGAGVSPTYDYDTLSRVTTLTPSGGSATSYGYDRSDNLTTLPAGSYAGDSGTYDDASELTSIGAGTTVSLAYDADGNRLSETQGSTTETAGTWNGADELTSYSVHSGADMSAAAYDGNGLRESNTVGSTTNYFVWDASSPSPQLLEDHADLYIYGPNGTPVEEIGLSGGTRKYLVADALGSVRAVVSSTGAIDGTTSYDSYGTPSGTGVSSNSFFGFAGGYTDATGLVYLVNRYYDPTTGQFLSVDPLVDETGEPYAYAGQDPVIGTDSVGLCDLTPEGDCDDTLGYESVTDDGIDTEHAQGSVPSCGPSDPGCGLNSDPPPPPQPPATIVPDDPTWNLGGNGTIDRSDCPLNRDGFGSAPEDGTAGINAFDLKMSSTVEQHISDLAKDGSLARPYANSGLTIQNIMDAGTPVPDPGGVPGALRWDVPGALNGSSGTWELVVDPQTDTILHFLFKSG